MNFKEWEEGYKCECKGVLRHEGCTDCYNTGYLFDSPECGLILDQQEEIKKLKAELEEARKQTKQACDICGNSRVIDCSTECPVYKFTRGEK